MIDPKQLEALERRLRSVREAPMRRELALAALEERPVPEAYALLAAALEQPEAERPGLPALRDALREALAEGGATRPFPYALRAALYAEAAARGDPLVRRLLRSADAAAEMRDPAAALPREVAEIPLGMRRSLARGDDPNLLDRLLLDPDPVVIEHLLENARITEDDVVRIAARRPIPASTLERIHASRRFATRPRVRIALARNPYCPTHVALAALAGLDAAMLREIAADATLHGEVRSHAADELRRRGAER